MKSIEKLSFKIYSLLKPYTKTIYKIQSNINNEKLLVSV